MNFRTFTISTAALLAAALGGSAVAEVAPQARELFASGEIEQARAMVVAELESNPKSKEAGALHLLLGECLRAVGDASGAKENFEKSAARGVADASKELGKMAMTAYDFSRAGELFGKYLKLKENARKEADPEVYVLKQQAAKGMEYLSRVDRLQVLDSINVDREEFFKQVRIPASSGRLLSAAEMPIELPVEPAMGFTNEGQDILMFEYPDSTGQKVLMECTRLTDGSWSDYYPTDSTLHIGDAAYPFMMADGTTLYFAAKGPQSIGGYDVFLATRDPSDNTYMMPTNPGMPYNSPADDFLLAFDEENGVGWLATDRNSPGGDVTLYVFIPNEIRDNYPPETEDIAAKARLLGWRSTQNDSTDYNSILESVMAIDPAAQAKEPEFIFPLPGGRVITSMDELDDDRTRELMVRYLEAEGELKQTKAEIASLRKDFHYSPSQDTASRILALERRIDTERTALRKRRNAVIKAIQH